jgi:hypothetical protein
MKLDALRTVAVLVTVAEANIGTAIPQNHRRAIYKIKATNLFAGPNLLTLGKRENGAVGTTNIDFIQAALQYDIWNDPDELKEDSAPLYIVEGPVVTPTLAAVGTSFIRAVGDAGNFYLVLWYEDTEAPV